MNTKIMIILISLLFIVGCGSINFCGNGIKESGETYETCCKDVGCLGDYLCISNTCEPPRCNGCQYLENYTCKKYECCSNSMCNETSICQNNVCNSLSCEGCTKPVNGTCVEQECCKNSECIDDDYTTYDFCEENKCYHKDQNTDCKTDEDCTLPCEGCRTEKMTCMKFKQSHPEFSGQQICVQCYLSNNYCKKGYGCEEYNCVKA